MESLPEGELFAACLAGSQRAWEDLVRRYSRLVYAVPARLGLPRHGQDEVFQTVFAELVRQLGSIDDPRSMPKWLMVVARRASIRWIEHEQHRAGDAGLTLDDAASPLELLESIERRQSVHSALEELGEPCAGLLRALFATGDRRSYQQVSDQLGLPVGSIGPMRARCLKRLTELYQQKGGPLP